jgi:hypothetical protein
MRMAALHRCRPLHGPGLIGAWRARAVYPDTLVAAVVQRSLRADVLQGWAAREALASRGDDLAVQDLLSRAGHAVFGAVLALNGVYFPHHTIKWQSHLMSELDVMPGHFAERLGLLGAGATAQALHTTAHCRRQCGRTGGWPRVLRRAAVDAAVPRGRARGSRDASASVNRARARLAARGPEPPYHGPEADPMAR